MTGYSPFEIMRGSLPRTKCNPSWLTPSTSSNLNHETVKENIAKTHANNKKYFDSRKSSKLNPNIKVGMLVKVKKPWKVKKGESQFMGPFEVKEILKNSVRLSNNKVWNLSKIAVLKADKVVYRNDTTTSALGQIDPFEEDLVDIPVSIPSTSCTTTSLEKRQRKKPSWMSDFISLITNRFVK